MRQTLKGLPLAAVPTKQTFDEWVRSIFHNGYEPIHCCICKLGGKYYVKIRDITNAFVLVDCVDMPLRYVQSEEMIQDLYKADKDFREYLDQGGSYGV